MTIGSLVEKQLFIQAAWQHMYVISSIHRTVLGTAAAVLTKHKNMWEMSKFDMYTCKGHYKEMETLQGKVISAEVYKKALKITEKFIEVHSRTIDRSQVPQFSI